MPVRFMVGDRGERVGRGEQGTKVNHSLAPFYTCDDIHGANFEFFFSFDGRHCASFPKPAAFGFDHPASRASSLFIDYKPTYLHTMIHTYSAVEASPSKATKRVGVPTCKLSDLPQVNIHSSSLNIVVKQRARQALDKRPIPPNSSRDM